MCIYINDRVERKMKDNNIDGNNNNDNITNQPEEPPLQVIVKTTLMQRIDQKKDKRYVYITMHI